MPADLVVIARDPLFGGGGEKQLECFLAGTRKLSLSTKVVFDAHPGIRGPRFTWRRVEALRVATAARRLQLPNSAATWVVSTHAYDGSAALHDVRPFSAWIGTTVREEWQARSLGLRNPAHRAAAGLSVPALGVLERRVLQAASKLYTTSPASRRAVMEAADREDVGILPIAIDVERFAPREEHNWETTLERPTLAFVGRGDDPRKNIPGLLEAARLLPDMDMVIAGSPPLAELPPNVRACGRVADVASVLRAATLFVLASFQEGFGIVVAEAMACGLPVVSTPCGGPEDMVREASAGVVTSGFSGEEIAAAVRRLLHDPTALKKMRADGRRYVERTHSPAAFAEALDEALET